MKKIIGALFVILVIILVWYFFGPVGFQHPKNYQECVQAGGRTNKNVPHTQDNCIYHGKGFMGGIF